MVEPVEAADIPVVLLAGGQGMRLREETERIPKPMVEIGGLPILWHIMKVFSAHGHRRFIICLGYKGWVIKDWFLTYHTRLADIQIELASTAPPVMLRDGRHEDWQVTCAETGLQSGSVGRLAGIADYIDTPYFMYSYGDSIADVNVTALRRWHESRDHKITMTGVRPRSRYGLLSSSEDGLVEHFAEKPQIVDGHANGGFMAIDRSVLDGFGNMDPTGFFEDDLLPDLVAAKQVGLLGHDGFWLGMDTMRDVVELEGMWQAGEAPWKVWDH